MPMLRQHLEFVSARVATRLPVAIERKSARRACFVGHDILLPSALPLQGDPQNYPTLRYQARSNCLSLIYLVVVDQASATSLCT
jgi:hypothetical protein